MKKFELIVSSENRDVSEQLTNYLKRWLADSEGLNPTISRKKKDLLEDEAGGELETILTVFIGSKALEILLQSVHVWMKEVTKRQKFMKSKFEIQIENDKGKSIKLKGENIGEIEKEIIEGLKKQLD